MSTDEYIMQSVSSGNISESATLFERYNISIYNYFRKLSCDKSLSEDLTQEVFERMIKYRHSYNSQYKFKPWLYRMASNVRYDHFRKQKIKVSENDEVLELVELEKSVVDQQIEESRKLHQAIESLSENHKEILVLCKLQKMKYTEVAKITKTSESKVKTSVHRSIKKLRQYYELNNWL